MAASPWRWPGYWLRLRGARRELVDAVRSAVRDRRPDVVLVPYPGHLAVRWLRPVVDVPVVLDLFLSLYGTAVEDRRLVPAWSPLAGVFAHLDRRACAAADLVLLDTPQHAAFVGDLAHLQERSVSWVQVADPEPPAACVPPAVARPGEPLELLYFGTGVPLHGLTTLIEATAAVDRVRLTLVGGTPAERELAAARVPPARLVLGAPFEPPALIRERLQRAHLVAGAFGTSRKADMVVPFKVVHALAHGRPAITADTAAVRTLLQPEVDCLVVPAGDPAALAARLRELAVRPDRLAEVGRAARRAFEGGFSVGAVGARLRGLLEDLLRRTRGAP
jgi:glycosyltransferase involved in cell wall biosynthesis